MFIERAVHHLNHVGFFSCLHTNFHETMSQKAASTHTTVFNDITDFPNDNYAVFT